MNDNKMVMIKEDLVIAVIVLIIMTKSVIYIDIVNITIN